MCSTQLEFEWTIDEVSSLNPANVEAHETQFVSVVDPELEAKAQAAISSYFKETIIGKYHLISITKHLKKKRKKKMKPKNNLPSTECVSLTLFFLMLKNISS